jgi:thioesterase domain-containing protein
MFKETHAISYIQQASQEWIEGDEEEIAYTQAIESLNVVPTDIQHGPKFYKGSKQPTSLWSKLCLNLRAWRAMVNQLSQYFINASHGHRLRRGLHY